jgi:hypothetical protein
LFTHYSEKVFQGQSNRKIEKILVCNEELHNLYSSPDISGLINEFGKQLAYMRELRNTFKISARKLNLCLKLNRRKIFKYILKKYDVKQ